MATGGFGSAQLLPALPYDLLAAKPKALMGYSDGTALNAALLARAGLASVHGPSPTIRLDEEGRPRECDVAALEDALALLLAPGARGHLPPRTLLERARAAARQRMVPTAKTQRPTAISGADRPRSAAKGRRAANMQSKNR